MTYILGQSITLQSSTSSEEPPRQSSPGCASTPVTRSWHLRYFLLFPSPHVMLHLPHGPQEVHIGSYVGNFYHQIRCVRLRTKTEISLIDQGQRNSSVFLIEIKANHVPASTGPPSYQDILSVYGTVLSLCSTSAPSLEDTRARHVAKDCSRDDAFARPHRRSEGSCPRPSTPSTWHHLAGE